MSASERCELTRYKSTHLRLCESDSAVIGWQAEEKITEGCAGLRGRLRSGQRRLRATAETKTYRVVNGRFFGRRVVSEARLGALDGELVYLDLYDIGDEQMKSNGSSKGLTSPETSW